MRNNRAIVAVVTSLIVVGCGKNRELERTEQQLRDAEARAVAAEKSAEEQRAGIEKARQEADATKLREANERKAAEKSRIDQIATAKAKKAVASPPRSVSAATFTRHFPAYVTAYDIMTPEDEFYFHHLDSLCSGGDLAKWPLVKSLVSLGQNLIDANLLANLANETIHISDQPHAAPIIKMVNECAEILQVAPPSVHIDGNSEPNAYVAGLREPHVLVLTSALLDLYDERPEELRFIIGHELGHIKCNHIKTHFLGGSLVTALVGDRGKGAAFAEGFVASLTVGTLLHWYRESEYSADRSGLLCVGGDVKVAKQALLRLVHQTKPSNKLFDPSHPEFDAQLVLKNQMRLRDEPFVKIISYLRQRQQTHPFIPERCAALGQWALSAEYQTIQERRKKPASERTLVITSIAVANIPKVDTYVPFVDSGAADPFVKITHAGVTEKLGHGVDLTDATWSDETAFEYSEGASLILEVLDYNATLSNKFIGSCLLPIPNGKATGQLKADLRLDVLEKSTIVDRPTITIEYRIEAKK